MSLYLNFLLAWFEISGKYITLIRTPLSSGGPKQVGKVNITLIARDLALDLKQMQQMP